MRMSTPNSSSGNERPKLCLLSDRTDPPGCRRPPRSAPLMRLGAAGLLLLAVGLGCGQLSMATTVLRQESGEHSGTWEVDLSIDQQVFDEMQRLSTEPIDLEYRASMLGERGWQGRAHSTGISASRSFKAPDEINQADNPIVMFFAADGETSDENPVRWTKLEIDDSDPEDIHYSYSAEVYVPSVDPDELMDEVVLSLSQGKPAAIADTDVQSLKAAIDAAGPFAINFTVTLPGAIDPVRSTLRALK